ncbi:MAG: hypothetical protein PUA83_04885 [Clostridiales bacterium]|nr:hypothetical protein [Clostridiales bacterium]
MEVAGIGAGLVVIVFLVFFLLLIAAAEAIISVLACRCLAEDKGIERSWMWIGLLGWLGLVILCFIKRKKPDTSGADRYPGQSCPPPQYNPQPCPPPQYTGRQYCSPCEPAGPEDRENQ